MYIFGMMISFILHAYLCHLTNMIRPAKRDQVGTKYISSENVQYLKFCVQYLLYVSFTMFIIKLFIDVKNFTLSTYTDQ